MDPELGRRALRIPGGALEHRDQRASLGQAGRSFRTECGHTAIGDGGGDRGRVDYTVREDASCLEDLAKLADVAGPRATREGRERIVGHALRGAEEMTCEQRNVVDAIDE